MNCHDVSLSGLQPVKLKTSDRSIWSIFFIQNSFASQNFNTSLYIINYKVIIVYIKRSLSNLYFWKHCFLDIFICFIHFLPFLFFLFVKKKNKKTLNDIYSWIVCRMQVLHIINSPSFWQCTNIYSQSVCFEYVW